MFNPANDLIIHPMEKNNQDILLEISGANSIRHKSVAKYFIDNEIGKYMTSKGPKALMDYDSGLNAFNHAFESAKMAKRFGEEGALWLGNKKEEWFSAASDMENIQKGYMLHQARDILDHNRDYYNNMIGRYVFELESK